MRFTAPAILIIVSAVTSTPNIVLTGAAKDCLGRKYVQVSGVTIGAFNPRTSRAIVDLLRSMDTATFADDDTTAMPRFEARYARLMSLTARSTALARTVSDSIGRFELSIPPLDSALVIGYADSEDELFYYSYTMVGARANANLYLDMSRGDCHYPDSR